MKCIGETVREANNLGDYYSVERNIPPLLICNPTSRVNLGPLKNSVLVRDININECGINRNISEEIYDRNIPQGNVPINIDMRPLPSSKCTDPKFLKERGGLEKYNQYEPSLECDIDPYIPGKGTVSKFFDNIDLDSELKNINKIDNKCGLQFFKKYPKDKDTKLRCYSDTLVKDNSSCNFNAGSDWKDYNKCSNFDNFPICTSKRYPCQINKENRKIGRRVIEDKNNQSGQIIRENQLNMIQRDLLLMDKKREAEMMNTIKRKNKFDNVSPDIYQYKSRGISNIHAPNIRVESSNVEEAKMKGYHDSLSNIIDKRAEINLNETIQEDYGCSRYSIQTYLDVMDKPNMAPFDCSGEDHYLYRFDNLMDGAAKDCTYCEKLFNNQTKRKIISPR